MVRIKKLKKAKNLLVLLYAVLSVVLTGCYVPHKAAIIDDSKQIYQEQKLSYYDAGYLISPGDSLEVTYHVDIDQKDQYLIAIGDQVRVEFFHYSQLDRTLNVRPDGRLTLPYKGDLMAAGLTPMQLAAQINNTYADFLTRPGATVSLVRYGARIRELKEAIRTAARGQSRLALVQPDGRVNLPLLSGMRLAGLTIDQAAKAINDAYKPVVPGMFTSSTLLEVTGNRVYVFGAVRKPGLYQLQGPTSILQTIGMAGGFAQFGQTDSTLLISRDEFNRPVGRIVDLASVLGNGNIGNDLFVKQSDVIFVPTTRLGRAALIGESIRRMIPVNLSFSYSLSDDVDYVE
ncbi:MAG: polysaccharide biosynthesis/export family protein [Pontibacterium sp.]